MSDLQHPYSVLPVKNSSGKLIFTPCPGLKGVSTSKALSQLKEAGAVALITLMSDSELGQNGLNDFKQQVSDSGLTWFHMPIEDDQAPGIEFESCWRSFHQQIEALLSNGKSIAIHCKGGSGRTGLMAALLLTSRNQAPDEVIKQIQAIRPRSLTLDEHTHYLTQWATNYTSKE
mgnify:CR=1 FL=1